MKTRFAYELIVGLVLLAAIFLFGPAGMVALVLLAAQPFIGKKKADERESQLFNKVGNYTAGATLLAAVIIFECSALVVNGILIDKVWLGLLVSAFNISHGAFGLVFLRED